VRTGPKKAGVAAAAATPDAVVDVVEEYPAEANGGTEGADATGLPHPGGVDEELSQEVEDDHEESARHEGRGHGDAPPEGGDAAADPTGSQSQAAEEDLDAGEDVLSGQHAPPGEGDAENSISETDAEAASEHAPEASSRATEPEARLDEVKLRHPAVVGNDLEDVVKMLQGGPPFPASTHLVVAGEIPDED
jgi:hypothetical protein